jgi:Ca-activated chloride channel family protein
MLALGIRVFWGDFAIADHHLAPPRDFWVGERDADVVLPCERTRIVSVQGAAVAAELGHRRVALSAGERVHCEIAGFRIEIEVAQAEAIRFGRSRDRSALPWFAGAALLAAGLLGFASTLPQPTEDELQAEQLLLIQKLLLASAEREVEAEQPAPTPSPNAKGVEGGRGLRFAVQGPAEPQVARQASLRDATEFGMIGVLSSGAGVENPAPAGGRVVDELTQAGDPFGDALDPQGAEEYEDHGINPPVETARDPLSTFAVDVDTGSFAIARRKLESGTLPPLASVRAEEFVNAFEYGYPGPESAASRDAFSVHLDAAPSPFDSGHHLLRVAIQGRRVPPEERPPVHLVYLVDTSGSMQSEDKLGLAQQSLRLLTNTLRPGDSVALQTYAGDVREVLPPTGIAQRAGILAAIDDLSAGGSTAMASGIDNAYRLAARTHVPGEISRVIVLSDGDTNVGPTSSSDLLEIIGRYRRAGITLSTVGFGTGNYKDAMMEKLANAGDGNYSYIGDLRDARRVFSEQAGGLLQVIARDVKVQVEFNPAVVRRYRLLGYENRDVADGDFRDDRVDGGEVGSGHAVTALYDLELWHTGASPVTIHIRHQRPLAGDRASEVSIAMPPERIARSFVQTDASFRFATSVAGFAEILRGSPYALDWKLDEVEAIARSAADGRPDREELARLVKTAASLSQALATESP